MTPVGRAVVRTYEQHIEARPAEVFPLLCPVREGDWLDGWQERCLLVRSASGFAEPGCVFLTSHGALASRAPLAGQGEFTPHDAAETTWVVTRHEPAAGAVEFCRVWPGVEAVTLAIQVRPADGGSAVTIRYTAVPLPGADDAAFDARWHPDAFARDLRWWELAMNHYLGTGTMLRHA